MALLKICASWAVLDSVLGLATCHHGKLEVRWRSALRRSGGAPLALETSGGLVFVRGASERRNSDLQAVFGTLLEYSSQL